LEGLGVHEHWNNPIDMKYSCNLGTGNGIELVMIEQNTSSNKLLTNGIQGGIDVFPNPVTNRTTIRINEHSGSSALSTI